MLGEARVGSVRKTVGTCRGVVETLVGEWWNWWNWWNWHSTGFHDRTWEAHHSALDLGVVLYQWIVTALEGFSAGFGSAGANDPYGISLTSLCVFIRSERPVVINHSCKAGRTSCTPWLSPPQLLIWTKCFHIYIIYKLSLWNILLCLGGGNVDWRALHWKQDQLNYNLGHKIRGAASLDELRWVQMSLEELTRGMWERFLCWQRDRDS